MTPAKRMEQRLRRLQEHLKRENPVLVDVVQRYQQLDRVAQKLGLKEVDESFVTQISWWPMVSLMGTFSAGKSSFINTYLEMELQASGNQAVDDRFTAITFSPDGTHQTLPGLALDGDPRFPFYQISEELEHVQAGEGARVDSYLQMKIAPSQKLKGRILIDSPGFDADAQRDSILRISDHIMELSDLVLVFFDARHPEVGAMRDTLEHLVKGAQRRNDTNKFLFILNQIDTAAREDNLEEIVSSWRSALVQSGLTAGNFYIIYNERLAQKVEDERVWESYREKSQADYKRIMERIDGVNTERVYRIIGSLETMTNQIEQQAIPSLSAALEKWRSRVMLWDGIIMGSVVVSAIVLSVWLDYWNGLSFEPPWLAELQSAPWAMGLLGVIGVAAFVGIHFFVRGEVAKIVAQNLSENEVYGNLKAAFLKSTRWWRSVFSTAPSGWGSSTKGRLESIRESIDRFVQRLNDGFTNTEVADAAKNETKES